MPAEVLFPNGLGTDTRCRLLVFVPASAMLPTTTVLRTRSAALLDVHLANADNVLGALTPVASDQPRAAHFSA
jgi:hypothetical protein